MRNKKIVSIFLIVIILSLQFYNLSWAWANKISTLVDMATGNTTRAIPTDATKYFYNQLSDDAKVFYDAMEKMLADGTLKTGTEYYVFGDNEISQNQLVAFTMGNDQLMDDFGAGRDAFSQDHPEVFYVDYDQFSIRVTQTKDGLKASMGTGRSDSYLNKQFANEEEVDLAIAAVDAKVAEIVSAAKNIEVAEGKSKEYEQIRYVHNEIIKAVTYKLETKYAERFDSSDPKNAFSIRTVYGAFVNKEAVCEGFSRALKMVLDRLNIPCVLVRGVYIHNSYTPEEHMWNYVQLKVGEEYKWYAVDTTFDNLDNIEETKKGIVSTEYLIVGGDIMNKDHVPTGIISDVNFEFTYPKLEEDSGKYTEIYNHN